MLEVQHVNAQKEYINSTEPNNEENDYSNKVPQPHNEMCRFTVFEHGSSIKLIKPLYATKFRILITLSTQSFGVDLYHLFGDLAK